LFEKLALVNHFETSDVHPVTGEEIKSTKFNVNQYAKKAIREFTDKLCTELVKLSEITTLTYSATSRICKERRSQSTQGIELLGNFCPIC
jgi:hypothetical protein